MDNPVTVTTETLPARSPANWLEVVNAALERNVDPDKLGKMLDLAERWEANRALETFGHALSSFQAECPMIEKTKKADRYSFAPFEEVWRVAGPIFAKNRIAVSFSEPHQEGRFEIICTFTVGSVHKDYPFSAPMPDLAALAKQMKLTEPQAFGIVLSYYKRYSLCAAGNIVATNEDLEAVKVEYLDHEQLAQIEAWLKALRVKREAFDKWISQVCEREITELTQIPMNAWPTIEDWAKRKLAKMQEASP